MYDNEDDDNIDYDKQEESFRNAILNKKSSGSKKNVPKKVKFNPRPLITMIFSAMVIVAVIAAINSKPKTVSVNKKIVDNIVFQDIIEDGTASKKEKINSEKNTKQDVLNVVKEVVVQEEKQKITENKGNQAKEEKKEIVKSKPKDDVVIIGKTHTVNSVSPQAIAQNIPEEMLDKIPKEKAYTIQVAAGKEPNDAKKMADFLLKAGYPAICIKEGTFYRVLVGNFPTREKATEYGNILLDKKVIKYFYPRYKSN